MRLSNLTTASLAARSDTLLWIWKGPGIRDTQQHLPLTTPALTNGIYVLDACCRVQAFWPMYENLNSQEIWHTQSTGLKYPYFPLAPFKLTRSFTWDTRTYTHILRAGLALTILTSPAKCVLSPYCAAYLKTCGFFHVIWWHFTV